MPETQTEPTDRMAAARAALAAKRAEEAPPPVPPGHVRVRVMKRGHDKIATGEICPLETVRFPNYRQGDETTLPRDTADKYEDAGMVEVLP
jgi:hypothetical protein